MSSTKLFSKDDSRVLIIDSKVTCPSCNAVIPVKQRKGCGVHDAKKLTNATDHHLQLVDSFLLWLEENNYITSMGMSAEDHRLQLKRYRYTKLSITKDVKQSHFQRTHSELLYWGILIKIPETNPPEYRLDVTKAQNLKDTRRFQ